MACRASSPGRLGPIKAAQCKSSHIKVIQAESGQITGILTKGNEVNEGFSGDGLHPNAPLSFATFVSFCEISGSVGARSGQVQAGPGRSRLVKPAHGRSRQIKAVPGESGQITVGRAKGYFTAQNAQNP